MRDKRQRNGIELSPNIERLVQELIAKHSLPLRLHDILRSILLGWTIRATAVALGLAQNTVRLYRQHVCNTIGIHPSSRLAAQILGRSSR